MAQASSKKGFSLFELIGIGIGIGGLALAWAGYNLQKAALPAAKSGGSTPTPTNPVTTYTLLPKGKPWSLIGDSLVDGLKGPLTQRSATYGSPFSSLGQSGSSILDWGKNAGALFEAADLTTPGGVPYQVIAISLGSNDAAITQAIDEQAALDKLLTFAASKKAFLVWIAPPATKGIRLTYVKTILQKAAHDGKIFLLDMTGIPLSPDGIHPTAQGYSQMATKIFSFLTTPISVASVLVFGVMHPASPETIERIRRSRRLDMPPDFYFDDPFDDEVMNVVLQDIRTREDHVTTFVMRGKEARVTFELGPVHLDKFEGMYAARFLFQKKLVTSDDRAVHLAPAPAPLIELGDVEMFAVGLKEPIVLYARSKRVPAHVVSLVMLPGDAKDLWTKAREAAGAIPLAIRRPKYPRFGAIEEPRVRRRTLPQEGT